MDDNLHLEDDEDEGSLADSEGKNGFLSHRITSFLVKHFFRYFSFFGHMDNFPHILRVISRKSTFF